MGITWKVNVDGSSKDVTGMAGFGAVIVFILILFKCISMKIQILVMLKLFERFVRNCKKG